LNHIKRGTPRVKRAEDYAPKEFKKVKEKKIFLI